MSPAGPAVNPEPHFPEQVLPVPFAALPAHSLPRDAAEMEQAPVGFIHGFAITESIASAIRQI